jgi:hypothetical protein
LKPRFLKYWNDKIFLQQGIPVGMAEGLQYAQACGREPGAGIYMLAGGAFALLASSFPSCFRLTAMIVIAIAVAISWVDNAQPLHSMAEILWGRNHISLDIAREADRNALRAALLENLEKDVWVRVAPSALHGVGLVAVRDIPEVLSQNMSCQHAQRSSMADRVPNLLA